MCRASAISGVITRGLRFRLTASYALFFAVLLIGVAVLVPRAPGQDAGRPGARDAERGMGRHEGRIPAHREEPELDNKDGSNWYYDADDPDETTIVLDIKKIYLIADQNGNVIQDAKTKEQEYSTTYDDIGIDPPELIQQRVREAVAAMKPGTPAKAFWDERKNSNGEPFLIRAGIVFDEGT